MNLSFLQSTWSKALVVACMLLLVLLMKFQFSATDNNVIVEVAEEVIQEEIGQSIEIPSPTKTSL